MDFFVSTHKAQTAEDDRDNIEGFAKAIQQRFRPGAAPILSIDPTLLQASRDSSRARTANASGSTGSAAPAGSMTARDSSGEGSGNTSSSTGGMTSQTSATAQTPKQVQHPPHYFEGITPEELASIDAFLIDIRPHAAYSSARLPGAVSMCVPTTLLKRPLFSLDRIAAMLPSDKSRQRFSKWRTAKNIIVYDADSTGNGPDGTLSEGSNIVGLLRKLAADESKGKFDGNLLWLKGGFQRVWKEARHLVESTPPMDDEDDDNNLDSTMMRPGGVGKPFFGSSDPAVGSLGGKPISTLRPSHLPSSAFSSSSSIISKAPLPTPSIHGPRDSRRPVMALASYNQPTMAANPFFDSIRQNQELSQGITERIPLRLPKRVRRRIDELPFQWLKDIGKRAAAKLDSPSDTEDDSGQSSYESESMDPFVEKDFAATDIEQDEPGVSLVSKAMEAAIVPSSEKKSPSPSTSQDKSSSSQSFHSTSSPGDSLDSLSDPDPSLVDEGMENLAMQFYRIELAEQRRLMGVMQHHTKESEIYNQSESMVVDSEPTTQADHSTAVDTEKTKDDVTSFSSPRQRTISSPAAPFPYSITAGVEKGTKNRYRHIWPFEHARVKLHQRRPDEFVPPTEVPLQRPPLDSNPTMKPTFPLTSSTSTRFDLGGPNPPGGALTGSIARARARTPSPSKPSTITSTAGPGGFNLTLPLPKKRGLNTESMPPPSPPNFKPSISITSTESASHPSAFTQYRNPTAGSGGSGGESTATESEWESGTDGKPVSRPSKRKDPSAERRKAEESKKALNAHDDYVNASYVQPLCTKRRYIATQGPLEATFTDFWTLVYQQNVHVIVMLTREIEGSMIKCGSYWRDDKYGPLRLKQISIEGRVEEELEPQVGGRGGKGNNPGGFFFPVMPSPGEVKKKPSKEGRTTTRKRGANGSSPSKPVSSSSKSSRTSESTSSFPDLPIIKRTFELTHTSYPDVPPRRIVHFQYLDWPDMNVPDDTRGLLGLIKEVDKAVTEADVVGTHPDDLSPEHNNQSSKSELCFFDEDGQRKHSRKPSNEEVDRRTGVAKHCLGRENAPVLLHCSAGVGRTGGFIAVDAVMDGIRRELRKGRQAKRAAEEKLEQARLSMEARVPGDDVVMDESSPSGSGSGNKITNADVDMADGTRETVPIAGSHRGDVFHVTVHRTMDSEEASKILDGTNPANISPPITMQVDVPMTAEEARQKHKEATDTSTRLWSQAVSDQTGHHGNADRVESAPSKQPGTGLSSSWKLYDYNSPALDSETSSGTTSDNSFGFASGFDKRFSGHQPGSAKPSELYPGGQGNSSSATSLSTGSGVGKEHRRTSSLARYLVAPNVVRDRTSSAPSGRPAAVQSALEGTPAGNASLAVPRPVAPLTKISSPSSSSSWILPEMTRRMESSPSPFSAADIPPSSRSISPFPTLEKRTNGSTGGQRTANVDSRPPVAREGLMPTARTSPGPIDMPRSGSHSRSASASRSGSQSHPRGSPAESDVLPTTGVGSSSLQGFDNKLDKVAQAAAEIGKDLSTHRAGFDFAEPRPLHQHDSPQALSIHKEPLWEVIQDMREQRMSLCQSLRQYVFVHAAVVEGALMVLDEENAKDGIVQSKSKHRKRSKSNAKKATSRIASDDPMSDAPNASVASLPSTRTSGSGNKRVASPTELPQEDKKGGQLLHKKPSLKRRNGTSSDESLPRLETVTQSPFS